MAPTNKKPTEESLKSKYHLVLEGKIDSDSSKVDLFRSKILPSLIGKSCTDRYTCILSECEYLKKSFSTKQKYLQHLVSKHCTELPDSGKFLLPNDKTIRNNGFQCSICFKLCSRRYNLQQHLRNSKNCNLGTILEVKDTNEIENLYSINESDASKQRHENINTKYSKDIKHASDECATRDSLLVKTISNLSISKLETENCDSNDQKNVIVKLKPSLDNQEIDEDLLLLNYYGN